VGEIRAESPEILTNTVVIHFFPNDWDLHKKVSRQVNGKSVEELYDPNADNVLEGVAKLVGQFGAGRVIIEGHTDSSLRGRVPEVAVKELSMNRSNAVKQALVEKYSLAPDRLMVDGLGWDRPADPANLFDHAKNRRVEIKVYPAESQ
jgi:outer membrane protein OmpA-like peptidoglycan-associated protein